jgi:hypothetical protein
MLFNLVGVAINITFGFRGRLIGGAIFRTGHESAKTWQLCSLNSFPGGFSCSQSTEQRTYRSSDYHSVSASSNHH